MNSNAIFKKMDEWFAQGKPFFFLLDYKVQQGDCILLESINANEITYYTPITNNVISKKTENKKLIFNKSPEPFTSYQQKFEKAKTAIQKGDSYLLNLTFQTPIQTNYNLSEFFHTGQAKYKLYYKNQFVHFSPETFVTIKGNAIATFPMKGTIDASLENAAQTILDDPKETTEQYIITDLLRNDLSIVADSVEVKKFRYLERIETNAKPLLQVSTHIEGTIKPELTRKPGTIFSQLLPAGSICGAPKKKTLEWIEKIENYPRHYYTGVWGIFDGTQLDSCVMIRMIERQGEKLVFKSGGGITAASVAEKEYQEMVDKIYVPIH
ncbi:MAG: aminodeoxychorismate synthase component I [Chitinophagaceae bacterium]